MFSVGPTQILLIFVIILLIFGAKKLPEIGAGLGKAIKNFKRATTEPDEIDITGESKKNEEHKDPSSKS